MTVLRAETSEGAAYDDPSEDLLFELIQEIEQGRSEYLIVERTSDESRQTYCQTQPGAEAGTYTFEQRNGSPDTHRATEVTDYRACHALLVGWAFDLPHWDIGRAWRPVVV